MTTEECAKQVWKGITFGCHFSLTHLGRGLEIFSPLVTHQYSSLFLLSHLNCSLSEYLFDSNHVIPSPVQPLTPSHISISLPIAHSEFLLSSIVARCSYKILIFYLKMEEPLQTHIVKYSPLSQGGVSQLSSPGHYSMEGTYSGVA